MPNDYRDISPVDPQNPFRNPTEEPGYSPDYRETVPEIAMPDGKLTLLPAHAEVKSIRRWFSLTFLMLLFAFFTSSTIYVALQMLISLILRQIDLRRLDALPQNYFLIVEQYLGDSSIQTALTLIAFLCGNVGAFLIGCKLTDLHPRDFFRLRSLRAPRTVLYILTALWIQLITSLLADFLTAFLSRAGISLYTPSFSLHGSARRILMLVLYTCVIAPITEELLLRGFVLKNLSRVSQRFAILLSALLFGIMHENLMQFLFTFPLGILLAYITIRHNSLTPAIITHMTVNALGILFEYGRIALPLATFRTANMLYQLAILLLGTITFGYLAFTERLPDQTPHQSIRSMRIAVTSPLFWALIASHFVSAWLTSM